MYTCACEPVPGDPSHFYKGKALSVICEIAHFVLVGKKTGWEKSDGAIRYFQNVKSCWLPFASEMSLPRCVCIKIFFLLPNRRFETCKIESLLVMHPKRGIDSQGKEC